MKLFFIFVILIPGVCGDVFFNEIMYNPIGSDKDREFVEIFHDEWINLSDYIFSDGEVNESLIMVSMNMSSNYSLIVESDSILEYGGMNVYVTDTVLGKGGLNNNDELFFYFNNSVIDYVKIDDSIGNNNGFSMEYYNGTKGAFVESLIVNGTPGRINSLYFMNTSLSEDDNNSIQGAVVVEVIAPDLIHYGKTYSSLFKFSIIEKNCSNKENIVYDYFVKRNNSVVNFSHDIVIGCSKYANTGILNIDKRDFDFENISLCLLYAGFEKCKDIQVIDSRLVSCNVSLGLESRRSFYDIGESIKYYNTISDETYDYVISYWIEDLFGNIVKKEINTTNDNQKSYKPMFDGHYGVYVIKNRLVDIMCNNNNSEINSSLIVPVRGDVYSNCFIEIDKVDVLVNGIKPTIRVYKGDTRKNSIKVWISDQRGRKVSESYSYNFYSKEREYKFRAPIEFTKCLDDGKYFVNVEGLEEYTQEEFFISDSSCKEVIVDVQNTTKGFIIKNETKYFVDIPEKSDDDEFDITIMINHSGPAKIIRAYSYIYRGSKSYTGDREENMIEQNVSENMKFSLRHNISNVDNGEYSCKVRIFEGDRKTPIEFTKKTVVDKPKNHLKVEDNLVVGKLSKGSMVGITAMAIFNDSSDSELIDYESTSKKSQIFIPIFFIGLVVFLLKT